MKKYNSGYQSQDDMDDQYNTLSSFTNPDPDDASWNPGNLDTHNADEEAFRSDSYADDQDWESEDYEQEEDL
jgi:hypothetical protein